MKLTEKQKNIVISAGEFNLSTKSLAIKLNLPLEEVEQAMSNTESEMSELYQTGNECAMFDVYESMRNQAIKGRSYASKMMLEVKSKVDLAKLKRELFGV